MKALQHLRSLVFMIRVLLAGIGLFSIISVLVDGLGGSLIGSSAQAAGELPRDVLAAQIRLQGVGCDKPLSAVSRPSRSRPSPGARSCACRKSSPSILVMQSTQDRTGQNASRCLGDT
jgi:hypothetical protein